MGIFARSRNISAFQHYYILTINKVKKQLRTGQVKLNRGISVEEMSAGVQDTTIQGYVAESRAHYMYHYTRRTTGVVLVSQDW